MGVFIVFPRVTLEGCETEIERYRQLEKLSSLCKNGNEGSPIAKQIRDKFAQLPAEENA